MIRPAETAEPAAWLADPDRRRGDVTVRGLLPPFPAYVHVCNRDEEPLFGLLDDPVLDLVYGVLAAGTATPGSCTFAVWEGYAGVPPTAATVDVRGLAYRLFHGAVADAPALRAAFRQSPNYAWPDDRAWCVATHVDLPATVVGCAAALAAELRRVLGPARATPVAPGTDLSFSAGPP